MADNLIYQIGDKVSYKGKEGIICDINWSRIYLRWILCIKFEDGTKGCVSQNNASVVKLVNTSSSKGE